MSDQENAELVRSLWAAVNERGAQAMRDFFAPDYVRHAEQRDYTLEEFIEIIEERQSAFPDNISETVDVIAQGDRVAYRWVSRGTHRGVYRRIPATGRPVQAEGITISRLANGKILEDWASWNKNAVLHSMGTIPIDAL